jgi:hypothetical protein
MNAATIQYREKVWTFLRKMQPGDRYKVSSLCTENRRELFIEEIKKYMVSLPYHGWISFNHDYSEFYKSAPVPEDQLKKHEEKS